MTTLRNTQGRHVHVHLTDLTMHFLNPTVLDAEEYFLFQESVVQVMFSTEQAG